jgi:signal peptidase I
MVGGFLAGLLIASTAPGLVGYRTYPVLSGSMTPAIRAGDAVVVASISPLQARIGNIVAFRDPLNQSRLYNHRVRAISRVGNRVLFITQGDENTGQEHWSVPVTGRIGRVIYRVPAVGFVLVYLKSPAGRIVSITGAALGLLALVLLRSWRPFRKPRSSHALAS